MAKQYSIDQVLEEVFDYGDSDDEFSGYVEDEAIVAACLETAETENENFIDCQEENVTNFDEVHHQTDCHEDDMIVALATSDVVLATSESITQNVTYQLPLFQHKHPVVREMSNKSPIDFFDLLLTQDIYDLIIEQTNLYAFQFIQSHELPPRSRVHTWTKKEFTQAEFQKFLSMILTMGIIKYPKLEDYFATSWPFKNQVFSSIMSRDRFSTIMKFLHLNNNENYISKGKPGYDPLYKLRPFLEKLLNNFQSNFNLGMDISVDEQMVSYKGRLAFLQYIAKKPTKWGMKAFVLSDSKTGYIFNWKLYTGM